MGHASAALGLVLLALNAAWWTGEGFWGRFRPLAPEQAFADGTFGLEIAPLKYVLVASTVSRTALQAPGGPPWPERFGFLRREGQGARMCEADAPGNLPVGFGVSNRLPGNAAPVPTRFVGLTCAACHAAAPDGKRVILGAGSHTADVIAFTDGFLGATLDPGLTATAILDAYASQCPAETGGVAGPLERAVDGFFIDSWLAAARAQARSNASKYDLPFHGTQLGDPGAIPTGPSRTRPFRSVVRNVLDLPGADNHAYSKVPLAAMQGDKRWSQFDGSIGDPTVRSMIAVFTSGASVAALQEPQIADNIAKAAAYTLRLGENPHLPTLAEAFPQLPAPSSGALARGREVYLGQCSQCHGQPGASGWVVPRGREEPSVTPLPEIGTDPYRLDFRYAGMLPTALAGLLPLRSVEPQLAAMRAEADRARAEGDEAQQDWWTQAMETLRRRSREYPAGHRMAFPRSEIEYRRGYLNAPIPRAWLRAPYLHNASVPTMRQLIGLDPRPQSFCRGANRYDPVAMGLDAREPVDGACLPATHFLFDTRQPGNSNEGHRYPPPGTVSQDDLEALLAYVGTL